MDYINGSIYISRSPFKNFIKATWAYIDRQYEMFQISHHPAD